MRTAPGGFDGRGANGAAAQPPRKVTAGFRRTRRQRRRCSTAQQSNRPPLLSNSVGWGLWAGASAGLIGRLRPSKPPMRASPGGFDGRGANGAAAQPPRKVTAGFRLTGSASPAQPPSKATARRCSTAQQGNRSAPPQRNRH